MDPYGQLRSGSIHGSELSYVFGVPVCNVWRHILYQFTKSEVTFSKAIMTYWTNFAKTGSPNLPLRPDDARNRYRAIQWESYDEHQKYFELGIRPRMLHHFHGHKMAVWLNLIPQLQKTGQNAIYPSHNSLTLEGPAWGIVRNNSRPNVDSKVLEPPPGTACMTLAESQKVLTQHNNTIQLIEAASKDAYSYALAVALGLGGVLCLLNGILLVYVCRRGLPGKRGSSGNNADQTATHSEISQTASELDFFGSSIETPQRRGNYPSTGNSLPRGGRRTLLLQQQQQQQQQRDTASGSGSPRRFSSSSDGRYISAPRPDHSSELVPLTSSGSVIGVVEGSPMRPGSSMSTATIRYRPSGAATTSRCHGHHRQQQQQQQQQQPPRGVTGSVGTGSSHHMHRTEDQRMSLTFIQNTNSDSPSSGIGSDSVRQGLLSDEMPAPPAAFSQPLPADDSPFRSNGFVTQIR